MSARLRRNLPDLKKLKTQKKKWKHSIKSSKDDFIACFIECLHNIQKGHVPLTSAENRRLKRHKAAVCKLAKERNAKKARKLILKQNGGFVQAVILPVLGAITAGLISRMLEK